MANSEITASPGVQEGGSSKPLYSHLLGTSEAITTLGLITARLLQQQGEAHLHINAQGVVEIIPLGELELDILQEADALNRLVQAGYTDQQLELYLQSREQRAIRRETQHKGV